MGRSWEEERSTLQAQIEALRRDAGGGGKGRHGTTVADKGGGEEELAEIEDLRAQLNEFNEREVGAPRYSSPFNSA